MIEISKEDFETVSLHTPHRAKNTFWRTRQPQQQTGCRHSDGTKPGANCASRLNAGRLCAICAHRATEVD